MKKKILIISGGISKERTISLETGKEVAKELKKNKYKVTTCEPGNNLLKNINSYKPEVILKTGYSVSLHRYSDIPLKMGNPKTAIRTIIKIKKIKSGFLFITVLLPQSY